MSGSNYFISNGGQPWQGPFNARGLRKLVRAGEISPETRVLKSGFSDWVPAERLRGLFDANLSDEAFEEQMDPQENWRIVQKDLQTPRRQLLGRREGGYAIASPDAALRRSRLPSRRHILFWRIVGAPARLLRTRKPR